MPHRSVDSNNNKLKENNLNITCVSVGTLVDTFICNEYNIGFTMPWLAMTRTKTCIICMIKQMEDNLKVKFISNYKDDGGLVARHWWKWSCNDCDKNFEASIVPQARNLDSFSEDICECLKDRIIKINREKMMIKDKKYREAHANDEEYRQKRRETDKKYRENMTDEKREEIRLKQKERDKKKHKEDV